MNQTQELAELSSQKMLPENPQPKKQWIYGNFYSSWCPLFRRESGDGKIYLRGDRGLELGLGGLDGRHEQVAHVASGLGDIVAYLVASLALGNNVEVEAGE